MQDLYKFFINIIFSNTQEAVKKVVKGQVRPKYILPLTQSDEIKYFRLVGFGDLE